MSLAILASACGGGGSPGGSTITAGAAGDGDGAGVGGTDSSGTGGTDSIGGGGGDIFGDGGSSDGHCQPTTCEAQGKTCGAIADGCGSVVDCGGCGDNEVCGLAQANICAGVDDLCVKVSQEVACADKQCGVEGDGCGGTIDCGTCPDGQSCGLVTAYQCAQIPGGTPTECAARIESCASVGVNCGVIGNGCGGTIDCDAELGGCDSGELCGADPNLGQVCAPFDACTPLDPSVACAGTCGIVSNGCGPEVNGGLIDCQQILAYACTAPDTCGGGGVPNECGHDGGAVTCPPIDQAVACNGLDCGYAPDGCGSAWDCSGGDDCANGSQCVTGHCTAIVGCTVLTKPQACGVKECGSASDNCGGFYDCGSCPGGEECGVLTAFQCDVPPRDPNDPGCVGLTQLEACAGKECSVAYDGCGTSGIHAFNCGSNAGGCPGGEFCGVQTAYQCDPMPTPPACVPNGQDCDSQGWACGTFVDNCGNTDSCGSCASNETCMGGITGPTTCVSVAGNGGAGCPLCDAVPTCASNQLTRLTGRVIAPGQDDSKTLNQVRVPNAFVYILRTDDTADLPAIGTGLPTGDGLSCDRCDDQDLGAVLVGAVTDANGDWELAGNIPVGQEFMLITKVGKFRRAQRMTLPAGAACTTTNLTKVMSTVGESLGQGTDDNPTRLPRSMSDGLAVNIPRMAITTGRIDAMECVFYKMGIAQSEYGNFNVSGTNRIDLYRGASSGTPEGASIDVNTPHDATLYNDLSRLEKYDMVVSDCEGGSWDSSFTQRGDGTDTSQGGKVRQYVNRGGRMFLSHLSFSWLHQNGTTAYDGASAATERATGLGQSSTWSTTALTVPIGTGVISLVGTRPRVSPRIQTFADWMVNESVTTSPGYSFRINDPRSQNTAIAAGTEEFVYRADAAPETTSTSPQYDSTGNGRVQQFSFNTPFGAPDAAACGRVAYSGFHVAATGGGTNPFQNATFPTHCTNALANNGNLTPQEKILLFMLFDLGTCVGEEPEPPQCTPVACDSNQCGTVSDGCGSTQICPDCAGGQVCQNNICQVQCVPTTCQAQGIACSTIADGCGGELVCPCNVCQPDTQQDVCAGQCGYQSDGCSDVYFCGTCPNSCVPATDCPQGITCGTIGDGCNGQLDCGTCPNGEVCGAYQPNVCDPPTCRPRECYDVAGVECGIIGDGCGDSIECGTCPPGQICTVVDGVPNKCAGCTPKTQQAACTGLECGLVGDGCGGTLNCGTCTTAGEFCGAVTPNMCDPGPQCQPQACPSSAECGVMGNGCGGSVSCGTCPAGQLCGVYEAYKCGGCTPQTCESAGAQCGKIGDGCGSELDCGECAPSFICGLGQPNKCAQLR